MVEVTILFVVMTEEYVDEPDTLTMVVTYCCVTAPTSGEVMVVALLSVERLMVEAAVPVPMTTRLDVEPVTVRTMPPVVGADETLEVTVPEVEAAEELLED